MVKALRRVPFPFCVVTLAAEQVTYLEYAHVVERATAPEILTKLEWSWGMQYQAFNVHTRFNIHPLDVVLHKFFDRKHNGWFWLPTTEEVIRNMRQAYASPTTAGVTTNYANARRDPKEFYDGNRTFPYRLIPFPAMDGTRPISAFPEVVSRCDARTPIEHHYYPFTTVPSRSLYVPYHFVICDTGRKLFGFYEGHRPTETNLEHVFPGLIHSGERRIMIGIWDIYDAWMHAVPTTEWQDDPAGDGRGRAGSSYASERGDGDHRFGEERQQRGQGSGASGTNSGYRIPPGRAPPSDQESWSGGSEDESSEDEPEDEEIEYGPCIESWATDVWESMQEEEMPPSPFDETLVGATGTDDR